MTIISLGIAWLAGIWRASVVDLPVWLWVTIAVGSISAAIWLRYQVAAGKWLAMVGVFCLDAAHLVSAEPTIDENHIAYYNGRDAISVTGAVIVEPRPDTL